MCGIVGYVGKENALPRVLDGLNFLEYRGYDSAGVAYFTNGKIKITKEVGRISVLEKKLPKDIYTNMAIGHTRWATHGEASKINSHPHRQGKFTVVHNGIIENYAELKKELKKAKVKFISETDTEVIPALLNYYYQQEPNILKCIQKLKNKVTGSYALGIICDDDQDHLYATRCGSPLIIAKAAKGNFIASDVPAILKYTNKYYLLDEYEIAQISMNKITIYNADLKEITKEELTFAGQAESILLNGYEHYMLKEIHEEDQVFLDTFNYYVTDNKFKKTMPHLKNYRQIHIVACGSAYYVGLIGKFLIERLAQIPVTVEVASEYRYQENFYNKQTLVIIISQSGETADSLAALRKAKEDGIDTLAIVNVIGSSIAREATYTLYIKAGPEIAVATTKAFLAQTTLMALLAIHISNRLDLLKHFNGLEQKIKYLLQQDYRQYAKAIYQEENIFYIGRQMDYALCLEGALKLKETSYINGVAYQAGELKHGTISLIKENTPVIGIATEAKVMAKTISNIKETKARKAQVILITNQDVPDKCYDKLIMIPKVHEIVSPILTVIPLQLIGYEVAKLRGCDIDKPKNLAKSVTVE